jgi:hypothetical protein
MRKTVLILLSIFLFTATVWSAETRGVTVMAKDKATGRQGEVKLYNKSYAVIIGIDKYHNLPRDKELSYAVRDAKGVQMVLEKNFKFDRIIHLYDENATKENILKLLTVDLPSEMGSEDSLFVFWAGHGNQKDSPEGEIGYLIPYDGSADEIYRNITMTEIRDTISRNLPAKHVFYVMDACYSGLLTTRSVDKTSRRDLEYLREITKERVRQVLTAGGKGQEVVDGGPKGHSVFTGRLIEVLEDRGDFITANEIQTILREKVYNDAKGMGHNQTPSFGSLSGNGDFVFIPNSEKKLLDNKAEVAKIEQELKRLETLEASAKQTQSAMKQREIEQQRMAAEAKLKAEKLRQLQLQDEERSNKELEADRIRFDAEQKKKELELAAARTEEEQRMAALKLELEKKKQSVSIASATGTIEAAVAEIRRLNANIDEIEAALKKELTEGRKRIETRYEAEISSVKSVSRPRQTLTRDEFETEAEFNAKVAKQNSGYNERINELGRKKEGELSELEKRISNENTAQTAELRDTIGQLSEKEYTLGAESLEVELGTYDIEREFISISLKNKPTLPTSVVQIAMNGTLPLPKDAARKFKQEWQSGLVRPLVTVKAGSKEVVTADLLNDADGDVIAYQRGEFITKAEKKKRLDEAEKRQRQEEDEQKIGFHFTADTALDLKTGLMWTRDGNIAQHIAKPLMNWSDAVAYCRKLNHGGYSDWRLPTWEELWALAQRGKDAGYGTFFGFGKVIANYFNSIGFTNVQSNYYWSSKTFERDGRGAWAVHMGSGDLPYAKEKLLFLNVWPVRGGQ